MSGELEPRVKTFTQAEALRRIVSKRIAEVIHEWDKERGRAMMEMSPISATDRAILSERIFERIFKEE